MTSRAEEIFFEVFEPLPRQGPGNLACAQRALALCTELPSSPRILDLGCGSGAQTLHLASLTKGTIVAVDSHAPLIERLRAKVDERGLSARVEARVGDMSALDLPAESFDLVWSEGALYNLGLAAALSVCAALLQSRRLLGLHRGGLANDRRAARGPRSLRRLRDDGSGGGRLATHQGERLVAGRLLRPSRRSLVGRFLLADGAADREAPREVRRRRRGSRGAR